MRFPQPSSMPQLTTQDIKELLKTTMVYIGGSFLAWWIAKNWSLLKTILIEAKCFELLSEEGQI
jgi:hypothetical protein